MTIDNSKGGKVPSKKRENKKDVYTSYHSLSQTGKVKSVSQVMHQYIKNGFSKFTPKND